MLSQKERLRATAGKKANLANAQKLAAMVETAGPEARPSEEEILTLILNELSAECDRWFRVAQPKIRQ